MAHPTPSTLWAFLTLVPVTAPHQDERIALEPLPLVDGQYGLAPGIKTELPDQAWRAQIGDAAWLFFDLDDNGVLEPGRRDGVTLEGSFNVVLLPEALLLPDGQFTLRFEKDALRLVRQELEVDARLVAQVASLTEMRIRGARTPVIIDEQACRHAELHLDYLIQNQVTRRGMSLQIHQEDPEAPGYTPEGALAGKSGVLGMADSFLDDLEGWHASTYHAVALLDPQVRRIGVARKDGHSLLFARERARRLLAPRVHPAHGQEEVPIGFSRLGEIPNPAPSTTLGRGCGFPVIVMLPGALSGREASFELLDPKGRPVKGFLSFPRRPANASVPDNAGCVFFLPRKHLTSRTRYEARLSLEGVEEPLVWSFTTRGAQRR